MILTNRELPISRVINLIPKGSQRLWSVDESEAERTLKANPDRHNMCPVDFDELVEQHSLDGMGCRRLVDALPALRGHVAAVSLHD